MKRRSFGAAAALAVLIVVVLLGRTYRDHRRSLPRQVAPVSVVGVEGEVAVPGAYLFESARVGASELIGAAGGAEKKSATAAGLDSLQLDSGERLRVFTHSGTLDAAVEPMDAASRLALGLKLDPNTASESDLLLIPQLKSETAGAIVGRRAAAPWNSLEELEELRGVGPKTVARWSEYLDIPEK